MNLETDWIRRFNIAVVLLHTEISDLLGLNLTDWKCGEIINRLGPMHPTQLIEITGMSSAATTLILDRLEKANFIRRERDPNDGRKIILYPVKGGTMEQRIATILDPANQRLESLIETYTPEQRTVIEDFMQRLTDLTEHETILLRKGSVR